ncbi:MAG: hypothetical protein IKQ55_02000 [Kiritimatiellae bacterium]|nr:hypothetical protein [Kiritimatiellia bacterium]
MKQRTKLWMAAMGALALVAAGAAPSAAVVFSPFGFAITSDAQLPMFRTGVVGLRLSLFGAANEFMYGLSLAAAMNGKSAGSGDDDVAGIQLAGLLNDAEGAEFGVFQLAGLANRIRGGGGTVVQLAGFYNQVDGPANGLQLAGVANRAEGDFGGVQLAGVCNVAEKDFRGVQLAAINRVAGTLYGIQLGAFNYAKTVRGLQIGAFNGAGNDMGGLSLAVFNINTETQALWPLLRVGF